MHSSEISSIQFVEKLPAGRRDQDFPVLCPQKCTRVSTANPPPPSKFSRKSSVVDGAVVSQNPQRNDTTCLSAQRRCLLKAHRLDDRQYVYSLIIQEEVSSEAHRLSMSGIHLKVFWNNLVASHEAFECIEMIKPRYCHIDCFPSLKSRILNASLNHGYTWTEITWVNVRKTYSRVFRISHDRDHTR